MSAAITPNLPPLSYRPFIVPAVRLERFDEPSVKAIKIKGYAADNHPCFYFHTYTLFEERFDCDDVAFQLATYSEQVIAWRLTSGKWLRLKRRNNRLRNAGRKTSNMGEPEEVNESEIAC